MLGSSNSSRTVDAVVIGGGVIGCSIAMRLAQARLTVTVVDRGEPGAEATSAAAGMLAPQGETIVPDAFSDLCLASRDLYPRFVAEIEELSGKPVGYHSEGTLLVAIDDDECCKLEEIYRAQTRHGLPVKALTAEDLRKRVPSLSPQIRRALFMAGDHWLDNERLSRALAESCRRLGVRFQTGCEAKKFRVRDSRVESVELGPGSQALPQPTQTIVTAAQFILAAGCWSAELAAPFGISLAMQPCRGQMIEFECSTDLPLVIRLGHHYLVPRPPGRVLAGTTTEYVGYEKEVTGEGLRSILEGTTRLSPLVKEFRLRRAWAGLRPDTADHLPILGYGEMENFIFATGHFRNGILLAPLTAQLISELILTRSTSRPIEAYRPARFARQRT